jgi:hypothetical protein
MLYKVTPSLAPVGRGPASARDGRQPKKLRASAVFDGEGHEVLITLMCLKCRNMKPLGQFGLRRMPDGAVRNQPWCRGCRGAVTPKKKPQASVEAASGAPLDPLGAADGPPELRPVADAPVPVPAFASPESPEADSLVPAPTTASPESPETDSLDGWAGLGRE